MTTYTCISCHVLLSTQSLHREHYKTDWHRYNLMRKVAELPPVTNEVFQQKAANQKTQQEQLKEDASCYCSACRKYFGTSNALQNHLKSKKHVDMILEKDKANVASFVSHKNKKNIEKSIPGSTSVTNVDDSELNTKDKDDSDDWESVDEEEEGAPIPVIVCLFCPRESNSLQENVEHMTQSHSFFIPDIEYLVDLEGLLTYLGQKIGIGNLCLWCSQKGRSFHSVLAVQQHMVDKGHCKLLHEGEALLEYSDYYDYSQSYPEEGKEEDTEAKGDGDEVDPQILEADDWQLVLPSGATIGHRSLFRYYRQNIPPSRTTTSHKMVNRLMHQYRALGWTGTTGETAIRKAEDIKFMHKMQAKQALKLGVKANKFQPHFRPQVVF